MLIGNRKIAETAVNQLIIKIKQKKELNHLAEAFVEDNLKRYLSQNPAKITLLSQNFSPRSSKYQQIIKEVRKELRQVSGLFKIKQEFSERRFFFEELLKIKPSNKRFLELHDLILSTHASSRERLDFYPSFYQKLFKITGQPKAILDLGCGINPFSLPYLKLNQIQYYAYDIDDDELNLIQQYFQYLAKVWPGFSGEAGVLNLQQWEKISQLKKVDVGFLWKITDVLERKSNHLVSEKVIMANPARFVVVSFPILTVSGKLMNQPRRKWIELMCQRLSYSYQIIKEKNEIFYVINKTGAKSI